MSYQSDFTGVQVDASVRDHLDHKQVSKLRPAVEVDGDAENVVAITPLLQLRPNSTFALRFWAGLEIVDGTAPYEPTLPPRWLVSVTDVFGHQAGGSGVAPLLTSLAVASADSELSLASLSALSPTVFGYNRELPINAPAESEVSLSYSGMIYTGASPEIQIAAVGVVAGDKYRYRINNYYVSIDPVKTVV